MKEKRCGKCSLTLPLESFKVDNKVTGKIHSYCYECQKAYARTYYASRYVGNTQEYKDSTKSFREASRISHFEYLSGKRCVDCGESDPIVLEFDHVSGEKSFSISKRAGRASWATIKREIEKCEIRCANCHRRKTAKQLNHAKYQFFNTPVGRPEPQAAL